MKSREESVRVDTKTTRKSFQYVVRVQVLSVAVDEPMIGEGTKSSVSIEDQRSRVWETYFSPGQGPRESSGPGAMYGGIRTDRSLENPSHRFSRLSAPPPREG